MLTFTREAAVKAKSCEPGLDQADSRLGQAWLAGEPIHIREVAEKLDAPYSIRALRFLGRAGVWIAARVATKIGWRALSRFEQKHPNDNRPRRAVDAAEKCFADPTPKNRLIVSAASFSLTNTRAPDAPAGVAGKSADPQPG